MIDYSPSILANYAEKLYERAKLAFVLSISACSIICVLIAYIVTWDLCITVILIAIGEFLLLGILVGYLIGDTISIQLKVQAQLILSHLQE